MKYHSPVWITWENQRRSVELAKKFGCELFLFDKKFSNKFKRYAHATYETISYLNKRKPEIVFCQNPSLALAALLCVLKRIYKYKLVIDRHSNFMFGLPQTLKYYMFMLVSNFTIKNADLTMVTNYHLLERYIRTAGGCGTVLPDKLPDMHVNAKIDVRGKKTILFITSFSRDEPIDEFFEAITNLPDDYYFYISGNYSKYNKIIPVNGNNYQLTGFVDEHYYKALLNTVDAVMVFTKHEHTLTCGAYEGVSATKPLILSNTTTIKDYFSAGALYSDMTPESINACVIECFKAYEDLKKDVKRLKSKLELEWKSQFINVVDMINNV